MSRIHPIGFVLAVFVVIMLYGCGANSPQAGAPLQVEEHSLAAPPQLDPLVFLPQEGTQADVLEKHALDRSESYARTVSSVEGNPAIRALGDDTDLLAVLTTSAEGQPDQTATLFKGTEMIFQTSAGLPSPVLPLQGLWAYDGHWAFEILYADQSKWSGQIFIDGELVSETKGYDEAFSFQLLAGKPFYFFRRNNRIGYSFNGQETDLGYEEIPHYRCCSESGLNPVQAQIMVAFFAERSGSWYYVELGDFTS
jgi:hypothetical protein